MPAAMLTTLLVNIAGWVLIAILFLYMVTKFRGIERAVRSGHIDVRYENSSVCIYCGLCDSGSVCADSDNSRQQIEEQVFG